MTLAFRTSAALLLLRIYFGLAVLFGHGLPKLRELAAGEGHFLDLVIGLGLPLPILAAWSAALSQVLGAVLVMLGVMSRPAAIAVAATIGFGVVAVHLRDGFHAMEAGLAYAAAFSVIALAGPGSFVARRVARGSRA